MRMTSAVPGRSDRCDGSCRAWPIPSVSPKANDAAARRFRTSNLRETCLPARGAEPCGPPYYPKGRGTRPRTARAHNAAGKLWDHAEVSGPAGAAAAWASPNSRDLASRSTSAEYRPYRGVLICAASASPPSQPTHLIMPAPPSGPRPGTAWRSCARWASTASPWWAMIGEATPRSAPPWTIRRGHAPRHPGRVPIVEALERCDAASPRPGGTGSSLLNRDKPERAILADPEAWYGGSPKQMGAEASRTIEPQ